MTSARRTRAVLAAVVVLLVGAAPTRAATTHRATTVSENVDGAATLALTTPAGVKAGDVMLATATGEGPAGFTPPAGWTLLAGGVGPAGYGATWYRTANASENATHTWNLGTVRKAAGGIAAYYGVDTSSPIVASAFGTGTGVTTFTAPSVTTTVPNTVVVVGFGGGAPATFTVAEPAGSDAHGSSSIATSGAGSVVAAHAADFTQATAGATPAQNFTTSTIANGAVSQIALDPGVLRFGTSPNVPNLPAITLNGRAQTATTAMSSIAIRDDSGTSSGWNLTVTGDTTSGKSPRFMPYCTDAAGCGSDPPGYVTGAATLPSGSLNLSTTGATIAGGSGIAPTYQCGGSCPIDAATPTSVASAAAGRGAGPWTLAGFGGSSLTLSTPSTLRTLPVGEVYRADAVWTLSSGP